MPPCPSLKNLLPAKRSPKKFATPCTCPYRQNLDPPTGGNAARDHTGSAWVFLPRGFLPAVGCESLLTSPRKTSVKRSTSGEGARLSQTAYISIGGQSVGIIHKPPLSLGTTNCGT